MDSLEEQGVPVYDNVDVTGKLGDQNLTGEGRRGRFGYKPDVFKSLDEVVHQRGILKPPSYKTSAGDDGELPITGKNARRLLGDCNNGGNEEGANGVAVVTMEGGGPSGDSMSLDELIDQGRVSGRRFKRPNSQRRSSGEAKSVQGADVAINLNKNLDPKSASLDELIGEDNDRGERGFKRKSGDYQNRRELGVIKEVDNEEDDGEKLKRPRFSRPVPPYRAVEYLSMKGMIIQVRIGKLVEENTDVAHLWRCEITSGDLSGIAESSRKTVAREIAAREFLRKLKEVYPDGQIPRHMIPNELYLDPKVFKKLEGLAAEQGLNISNMITIDSDPGGVNRNPVYKCTWMVDDDQFVGESREMEYAKLEAAGKAYASITGEPFPRTTYFVGENCKTDYEFIYNESEIYYTEEDQTKALEDTPGAEAIN